MTTITTWLGTLLLMLVLPAGSLSGTEGSLASVSREAYFKEGTREFAAGVELAPTDPSAARGRFAKAAAAWRTIVTDGGVRNPDLERNIGNASMLAGDAPRAIAAFRRNETEQSVDFSGVASAVLEGIRKETGLRKFLLAGNSLGGGVILWDHASLAKDENLKFMLVAPTQVFMPDIDKIGPMDNTALIAHRRGDDFVKDRKILSWIAANQSPLTKEAESRDGHIIVGQDLGHKQFASAIASFLNLPSR
jgi:hypothetical protein